MSFRLKLRDYTRRLFTIALDVLMRIKQQPQSSRRLLHSLIVPVIPARFIKTALQHYSDGHLLRRVPIIAVVLQ